MTSCRSPSTARRWRRFWRSGVSAGSREPNLSSTPSLSWPFFDPSHVEIAREARAWAQQNLHEHEDQSRAATDAACRELVAALGKAGFTRHCVPQAYGGTSVD